MLLGLYSDCCQGMKFLKKQPDMVIIKYGINKKNTLQISKIPLVLYTKPLVRAFYNVNVPCRTYYWFSGVEVSQR